VSLLGALVSAQFGGGQTAVLFVSLSLFFSACVLYLALVPLIVNRLELLSLAPLQFTPDYWIDMGAMAITTLAGSMLLSMADRWSVLQQIAPFLLGLCLLFWAGATWWIPLLILLEVWRHVLRHVRLGYGADYWSAVFPVGMYAACTFALADLVHLPFLLVIAQFFTYLAFTLWVIAFASLALHALRAIGTHPRRRIAGRARSALRGTRA
jgi:tellurite resistance protein TehA-like permease